MTLDQLRIFVAVAERQHLTRAAEALHLTPSTLSAAIHALEQRYGTRLFHRVGRRIELSDDGQAFLGDARAALASAEAAELALRELGGLQRGTLSVAASQTIVGYWLPAPLIRFADTHRAIDVRLTEGNTTTVAAAVRDGRCELGFIEGTIDEPALASTPIDEDRLVVVAGSDNPIARRPRVDLRDLVDVPWVMREEGSGTRALLESAMRDVGVDPASLDIRLALPTNEGVCAAVRSGPCLTAVSELCAGAHIEGARLRRVAVTLPTRRFSMLRHKERYRTKASLAFVAMLGEEVAAARARRDPLNYDI